MNYIHIYNSLINRAIGRTITEYTESHHIVPVCIGGTDDIANLVNLTPEEHYVAHQLLIKVYPHNRQLIHAATMMCVFSEKMPGRSKNKLFGWLRRKLADSNKISQSGAGNSQYGTCWVYNIELKISKKIQLIDKDVMLANGWALGRKLSFNTKTCKCGTQILDARKYCSNECKTLSMNEYFDTKKPLTGREEEFLRLFKEKGNMNAALIAMGFPGATSCYYTNAKKILGNTAG